MHHYSIEQSLGGPWVSERRLLSRLLRSAFAVAGILWILVYWIEAAHPFRHSFTIAQYQLYLFLLTLWGYDYRRQWQRVAYVLQLAHERQCIPQHIRWDDIATSGKASLFDVLRRRPSSRAWFPVSFTWLLLACSYLWLGRQVIGIVQTLGAD